MHAIETWTFPTKTTKKQIAKACNQRAIEDSDCHGGLYNDIRFNDTVLKSEEDAYEWIKTHDRGWYDNLAIRFKRGRSIFWLVKFEYHC